MISKTAVLSFSALLLSRVCIAKECFYGVSANDTTQLVEVCMDTDIIDVEIEASGEYITDTYANADDLDMLWILLAGFLVFFMQTGFTLLEAGMVKHTNVQNILFKNLMDACIGGLAWYLFGYTIAYGSDNHPNEFGGNSNVAVDQTKDWNGYFFQWAFAATAATIVSGSVAERTTIHAYFAYTVFISIITYPIVVHWMWSSDGWLSPFNDESNTFRFRGGVMDFAGSGVVHMVGGFSGLMGAIVLGPRKHRFDGNAQKHLLHQFEYGHNVPFQVLGTFILWFGWYGFNAGSTLGAAGLMELAAKVAVNTTLAAATGGIAVAVIVRATDKKWKIPAVCNGVLAGLVSITAPCSVVTPGWSVFIGAVGGVVYLCASGFLLKMHVDDPLNAWAVHGMGGAWGVISVGLLAYEKKNIAFAGYADFTLDQDYGTRLGTQILAVVAIASWTMLASGILFGIMGWLKVFRVDDKAEETGLDIAEHGGVGVTYKRAYSLVPRAQMPSDKDREAWQQAAAIQEEDDEDAEADADDDKL